MNSLHPTLRKMSLLFSLLLLVTACSKDADLLSDYVIAKDGDLQSIALLVDDQFFIGNGQTSIVMDVLNNDSFNGNAQVTIVETSTPQNGEVVINSDNTLTYSAQIIDSTTPEDGTEESPMDEESTNSPVDDSFTYTTEVTTQENEVFRQEATVTITSSDMGELKAFPGAEGFGKFTTGGRGGQVIHVTNLNDSGPGSLRAALERTGKRTIVFDIGGDIFLSSSHLGIYEGYGDLTIAGETAPYPGITIRGDRLNTGNSYGGTLDISANNIIIRYISIRGNNAGSKLDALRLRNDHDGMKNIIIDHVSTSHSDDGNIDIQNASDLTIQNSMLTASKGSGNSLYGNYNNNITILGNYFSHTSHRNMLFGYGKNGENFEYINNIVYMHSEGATITYGHVADLMGNIFKGKSGISNEYPSIASDPNTQSGNPTDGSYYVADNFELMPMKPIYDEDVRNYSRPNRQITNSLITSWAKNIIDIEERVFGGQQLPGNSLFQDTMDEQAILDYFNGSGNLNSLIISSKASSSRSSAYDTDNDGMADEWEISVFGDLSKTPNGDENGDGYTNIESFLYSLTN